MVGWGPGGGPWLTLQVVGLFPDADETAAEMAAAAALWS